LFIDTVNAQRASVETDEEFVACFWGYFMLVYSCLCAKVCLYTAEGAKHTVCEDGFNLALVTLTQLEERLCAEGCKHGDGRLLENSAF
jgi:hypothetical protein